ncbi:hypothetical protein J5834_01750, partial [bacterium]|nr:hypothetical protein [bacterium]
MRKFTKLLTFLSLTLISVAIFAQDSVALTPTVATSDSEKKIAREIDENLSLLLSTIKTAKVETYSSGLARCKSDLKCIVQAVVKSDEYDFVLIPKISKHKETKVSITLYDKSASKKGSRTITAESGTDSEDIASDMINAMKTLLSSVSEKSEPKKAKAAPAKTFSYSEVKEEIKKGFTAYDNGNIEEAEEIFDRAANEMNCKCAQNETAKTLLADVKKIKKGLANATDSLDSGDYKAALRTLESVRTADNEFRELGYKNMVYKKDKNMRKRYLEPNPSDAQTVEQIHKSFKAKIDEVRKWKTKQLADIDKWLNDNIKAREKAITDLKTQQKENQKKQKADEAELKK